MSSLFNIEKKHLQLLQQLEDTIEGMDFETTDLEEGAKDELEALKINEDEAKEKIKSYYFFIKHKEGEMTLIKDEIERLKSLHLSKEKLIKKLKDRVNDALKLFGNKTDTGNYKLDCDNLKVWNVHTKPVVTSDDFNNPEYGSYIIKDSLDKEKLDVLVATVGDVNYDYKPNKTKIKSDLQSGVEIEGAHIDKDASYVRFK